MTLARQRHDRVRRRQQRRGRAVVLGQCQQRRRRHESGAEVEDVAHLGGAEGVDRLRVVADDGEAAATRPEREHDLGLQPVGVLVLVDQDVVEAASDRGADRRVGHRLGPPDEQVVEVEHALRLLLGNVGGEQSLQAVGALAAPGEGLGEHVAQAPARVDDARVDRQAGRLLRKALAAARQPEALAQEMEQLLGIAAIIDRESRVESDARGVQSQQPRADGMEGAAPRQTRRRLQRREAERFVQDAADAALHLERGAAREGEEQDARRVRSGEHQPGDPRRERQRLAGPGAGDDQQRLRVRDAPSRPNEAARRWPSFKPASSVGAAAGAAERSATVIARRARRRTLGQGIRWRDCKSIQPATAPILHADR